MALDDHKYIPGFHRSNHYAENSWALVFIESRLLMRKQDQKYNIPRMEELSTFLSDFWPMDYIGTFDDHDCYCMQLKEMPDLPGDYEPVNLREITSLSGDPQLFLLAGNANHILHWKSVNQFCGRCGTKTVEQEDERAMSCPSCGNLVYPRISPATITAVFHGDKILLAHNSHFREKLYSLIAGFVEPGETLEQCVEREVREEVGIKIKNIRYYGSQPWPLPDALMLAFTAEYDSGEISVDNKEIKHAAWYSADSLPEIPSIDSVAGKIIRWYRDQRQKKEI